MTVCTYHKELQWILITTEAISQLVRLRLRLSYFQIQIICSARLKHQAASAMSRLKTECEKDTLVNEKAPVCTKPQDLFDGTSKTEVLVLNFVEKLKGRFVSFGPEVCVKAGITDNRKIRNRNVNGIHYSAFYECGL